MAKVKDKTETFWSFSKESESEEATLRFYGAVCSEAPVNWWTGEQEGGDYITPAALKETLDNVNTLGVKTLNININSYGGDAYTGIAISNVLKSLTCKKVVTIDGIAASAAATIACSADVLRMYPGSLLMIHNAAVELEGSYGQDDLKKYQKALDAVERASAEIYSAKSGLDSSSIRNLMDKETYMTAEEATAKGFCNEVIKDAEEVTAITCRSGAIINGLQVNSKALKEFLNHANNGDTKKEKEPMESKTMTAADLLAAYPAQIKEITEGAILEAVNNERVRMQEIDSIAQTVNDAELIQRAKYVEPMKADKLALCALQKAGEQGKKFLSERKEELKQNANIPAPAPALDDETALKAMQEKADAEIIEKALKAVNSIKH